MKQLNPDSHLWELLRSYLYAKETVINLGFGAEVDWQDQIVFDEISEEYFMREAAWVILSSGMRERVIRLIFAGISRSFFNWKSAEAITAEAESCRAAALSHFNHAAKIDAILYLAHHVSERGFLSVREDIRNFGVEYICDFPFMGPATSRHFAKNIGLQVVKPDRHLLRIADAVGYSDPARLCEDISIMVGDKVSVVDVVLWRYATLHPEYLSLFPDPRNPSTDPEDCGLCWLH